MSTCASCGAELEGTWKFCLRCGAPIIPGAIRPEEAVEPPGFNLLAIVALMLACIGGAPAFIFGHFAIAQIRETGERGIVIARIATVLGYLWLAVWITIIVVLVTGASR